MIPFSARAQEIARRWGIGLQEAARGRFGPAASQTRQRAAAVLDDNLVAPAAAAQRAVGTLHGVIPDPWDAPRVPLSSPLWNAAPAPGPNTAAVEAGTMRSPGAAMPIEPAPANPNTPPLPQLPVGAEPDWRDSPRWQAAAPLISGGRNLMNAAAALATPVAVLAPAAIAAASASDEYGDAGGMVSGVTSAAGGLGGAVLGSRLGELVRVHPGTPGGRTARMLTSAVGALVGSGAGGAAGGAANSMARGFVDQADRGETGFGGTVGQGLDALGYRSSRDLAVMEMNRLRNSPEYLEMQRQREAQELSQRRQLLEGIAFAGLTRGF
jgi:hypothetical protein